jgi:riboflavin biosynthesis pyrimidine reductase
LAEEVAAALDATDSDVGIGGAGIAAAAIEFGLVDELLMFRSSVVAGGGTHSCRRSPSVPQELIETTTFGSRVVDERYGRTR